MQSGFIYLWFDRKHKRFYLGKHWGPEDDGYICSSKWMKRAHTRRPQDFKRRILERVLTSRDDLGNAERRWGLLIKDDELGTKYYNLKRPEDRHWHNNPDSQKYKTISEKISAKRRGQKLGPCSEEKKLKLSRTNTGYRHTEEARAKMAEAKRNQTQSQETREKKRRSMTGKVHSEETKRKIREAHLRRLT